MPTEFTVEQMWNTPRTGENIAGYANRVNPAFDWRKSLLGNFNFNNQSTPTATTPVPNNQTQPYFQARDYSHWQPTVNQFGKITF